METLSDYKNKDLKTLELEIEEELKKLNLPADEEKKVKELANSFATILFYKWLRNRNKNKK